MASGPINATTGPAFLDAEVKGEKSEIPLTSICRVGRNPGNDLVLEDKSVSRNHALVYSAEGGAYCVHDLGSGNGTFVNGTRVSSPTRLTDGDTICFGSCLAQFRQKQAPVAKGFSAAATHVFFTQKLITTMVVDIRGFTMLAQQLDESTIAKVTGALFREAGGVLRDRGAWGQKYIGDAVMAVWLHSDSITSEMINVMGALASLIEIARGLQAQFGLPQAIRIGAGINSGLASLGNAGSAEAPDYTALGDAVNRAFRLESATKEVGWDVLFGEKTYQLISPLDEVCRLLQSKSVRLKGYEEPVTAWGAKFQELAPVLAAVGGDVRTRRPG